MHVSTGGSDGGHGYRPSGGVFKGFGWINLQWQLPAASAKTLGLNSGPVIAAMWDPFLLDESIAPGEEKSSPHLNFTWTRALL